MNTHDPRDDNLHHVKLSPSQFPGARRLWRSLFLYCLVLYCLVVGPLWGADKHPTGPSTEDRFPPLILPEGFQATLFACDPLVEYPSVIALGPKPGTLLVAHDYVTGLGVEIVRRDEVRVVRDTDQDGYADDSLLLAAGFNSIQGLASDSESIFVMHAPLLTRLVDSDGDFVVDKRTDLLTGLGLAPEENSNRLHCANGVVVGHDGWLYLALGDRGCDVQRPEGDRLLFQEGGILRCRPDGTDLHVYCSGLRNIYDLALDEQLNVFTRDNENDGGDYMIRVCFCFHGSDHGYPYLYNEHPHEAMTPLADLGRGSSAGGTAYLERSFPPPYRDSLFFCEWGRSVVRYFREPDGSGFAPMQEEEFIAAAPNDPYGLKPTDLVVDHDGSLLVSDWGDGQRPKRGRGRIYRISATTAHQQVPAEQPASAEEPSGLRHALGQLNSESYRARVAAQKAITRQGPKGVAAIREAVRNNELGSTARLHAVWIQAHVSGAQAVQNLLDWARTDSDARVRAQAIRAIADLSDPVLRQHRLKSDRGDQVLCRELSELADDADPRVTRELFVALGRLRFRDAAQWLSRAEHEPDPVLNHAAMILLRRADNWPAVLELLDLPGDSKSAARGINTADKDQEQPQSNLREIARRALASQWHETVATGLVDRLHSEQSADRQSEIIELLSRIHRQPAKWTYWGFRPDPRPAHSVTWQCTELIESALVEILKTGHSETRAVTARRMLRNDIPIPLEVLSDWLVTESDPDAVAAILEALQDRAWSEGHQLLESIIRSRTQTPQNRLAALAAWMDEPDPAEQPRLLAIAKNLEEGTVLAAVLRELGTMSSLHSAPLLLRCLEAGDGEVRAAAAESLSRRPVNEVIPKLARLLHDEEVRVRRAAARMAGVLQVHTVSDRLLHFSTDADLLLRSASLQSLDDLDDPRAITSAVKALHFPECQRAAIGYLASQGNAAHREAVAAAAMSSRTVEVLVAAVNALTQWQLRPGTDAENLSVLQQSIAEIQSKSGVVLQCDAFGPLSDADVNLIPKQSISNQGTTTNSTNPALHALMASTQIVLDPGRSGLRFPDHPSADDNLVWLAATDLYTRGESEVEFLVAHFDPLGVWLNERLIYAAKESAEARRETIKISATLAAGNNRLLFRVPALRKGVLIDLRLRHKSSIADHEKLTALALAGGGNLSRGREIFMNAEKTQCLQCHRLNQHGKNIGPDLTGIGSRFSRIHLIESILEPSRSMAPSYESWLIALDDGRLITGIKLAETSETLTIADNTGKVHQLSKPTIDSQTRQSQSIMPAGLEKRLTDREFLDLIRYLVSEKKSG